MRLSDIYSRCLLPKRVRHVYKMGVFRALCPLWPASGALHSLALPGAVVILFSLLLHFCETSHLQTALSGPLLHSPLRVRPSRMFAEELAILFWMSHFPHFPSFVLFFLSESRSPSRHMATCFLGSPLAEPSLLHCLSLKQACTARVGLAVPYSPQWA